MIDKIKLMTEVPEQFVLHRRIGSTTYRTRVLFNPDAKETLDEKVLRLLKNDLNHSTNYDNIISSQTSWLPEGSTL
jgi:hypothetical protein